MSETDMILFVIGTYFLFCVDFKQYGCKLRHNLKPVRRYQMSKFFKYKKLGKPTYINLDKLNVIGIESEYQGKVKIKSDNGVIELCLDVKELSNLIAMLEGDK